MKRIGLLVFTIATLCLEVNADLQNQTYDLQLFRGKLVGVSFAQPADHGYHRDLRLQFLVTESYALVFAPQSDRPVFTSAALDASLDPRELTEENFNARILAALPADIRMGSDCLVEVSWADYGQRILRIVPNRPGSINRFISGHFDYIYAREDHLVQSALTTLARELKACEHAITGTEQTLIRDAEQLDEAAAFDLRMQLTQWKNRRASAIVIHRKRLTPEIAQLKWLREYAPTPEARRALDELLAAAEQSLAELPDADAQ